MFTIKTIVARYYYNILNTFTNSCHSQKNRCRKPSDITELSSTHQTDRLIAPEKYFSDSRQVV